MKLASFAKSLTCAGVSFLVANTVERWCKSCAPAKIKESALKHHFLIQLCCIFMLLQESTYKCEVLVFDNNSRVMFGKRNPEVSPS